MFVDEMAQWLASLGGFLGHTAPIWNSPAYTPVIEDPLNATLTNGGSGSNNESRYSSLEADFGPDRSFMTTTNNVAMDPRVSTEGQSLHMFTSVMVVD